MYVQKNMLTMKTSTTEVPSKNKNYYSHNILSVCLEIFLAEQPQSRFANTYSNLSQTQVAPKTYNPPTTLDNTSISEIIPDNAHFDDNIHEQAMYTHEFLVQHTQIHCKL
jgi:hypothetical protein